jgi:hypothetical protein
MAGSGYASNGTDPIHYMVTSYDCGYRDYLTLQGTGVTDGTYLDGEIAHAYRSDYRVIYSNGTGHSALSPSGDWARLIANSCGAAYFMGY